MRCRWVCTAASGAPTHAHVDVHLMAFHVMAWRDPARSIPQLTLRSSPMLALAFYVTVAFHAGAPPVQRPLIARLHRPVLTLEPEAPSFADGIKSVSSRFKQNFVEGQKLAKARLEQAPVAAAADGRKLWGGSLALSLVACELIFFSTSLLIAWALGISPAMAAPPQLMAAVGKRTAIAMGAAAAFRCATRPLRLALQLGCVPLVAKQAALQPAPLEFLKERALQCAAVAACILLTLRALERGPLLGLSGAPLPLLLSNAGLPSIDGPAILASAEQAGAAVLVAARRIAPVRPLLAAWCALANLEELVFGAAVMLWRGFLAPLGRLFFKGETDAPVAWLKQLRAVILQTLLG